MTDFKQKLMRFASVGALIVAMHAAEYDGHYTMFGGGSPSGNTTTTTNTNPWSGQQPYLTQQYQQAQKLFQNPSDYPQYYPGAAQGSEVAPLNPTETGAIQQAGDVGINGTTGINSANNALTYYNNGNMLSAQNPYFQSMADTVRAQVQPQLTSSFNAGNNMNNPGAAFAVSQGLGNAIGNLAYQNYSDQSKNQLTAAQTSTGNDLAQQMGASNALAAGQAGQTTQQNIINNAVQGYNYNQTLPFQMLDQYAGLIAGNPGSSSTQTQPYFNNTAQNVLGTASQLGTLGYLGYLALSDRRLKKNIKRCGTVANLNIYEFEYLWGEKKHIGFMADEVEQIAPDAVMVGPHGFKMVNYARIA